MQEDKFTAVREQTKKGYFNFIIKPKSIVRDIRLKVIQTPFWTAEHKHSVIDSISCEQIRHFADSLRSAETAYIQGLVQGNLSQETAVSMFQIVSEALEGKASDNRQGNLD